jgi:hypothetical protein
MARYSRWSSRLYAGPFVQCYYAPCGTTLSAVNSPFNATLPSLVRFSQAENFSSSTSSQSVVERSRHCLWHRGNDGRLDRPRQAARRADRHSRTEGSLSNKLHQNHIYCGKTITKETHKSPPFALKMASSFLPPRYFHAYAQITTTKNPHATTTPRCRVP